MQPGQSLVVVGAIDIDVLLDPRLKGFTNGMVNLFAAARPQQRIAEVGMHAAPVPIALDRLAMPVDHDVVLLSGSLQ